MNNFGHWEVSLSASTPQYTQNGWSPGGSIALLQYDIQEPVEGSGAVTLYQCMQQSINLYEQNNQTVLGATATMTLNYRLE